MALSTVFHSINSPDNSPLLHSVLPVFLKNIFFYGNQWTLSQLLLDKEVMEGFCSFFYVSSFLLSFFLLLFFFLFFRSYFCLSGPFNYISLSESLLQS